MSVIVRPQEEIDDLINRCFDAENNGDSKYPGMTYEQGIKDGMLWLTDEDEPNPLED